MYRMVLAQKAFDVCDRVRIRELLTRLGLYQDVVSSRLVCRAFARRDEPLRRCAVRVVSQILEVYGEDVLYETLKLVAYSNKFKSRCDTDMTSFLKSVGITMTVHGRKVVFVGDGQYIEYEDDYYFSYTYHLLKPILAKIPYPLDLMPMEREPHSYYADLRANGFPLSSRGMQEYLATFHDRNAFPAGLKYRLLGGRYPRDRRPINFGEVIIPENFLYPLKFRLPNYDRQKLMKIIFECDGTEKVEFEMFPAIDTGMPHKEKDQFRRLVSFTEEKRCFPKLVCLLNSSFSFKKLKDFAHGEAIPDRVVWSFMARYSQRIHRLLAINKPMDD